MLFAISELLKQQQNSLHRGIHFCLLSDTRFKRVFRAFVRLYSRKGEVNEVSEEPVNCRWFTVARTQYVEDRTQPWPSVVLYLPLKIRYTSVLGRQAGEELEGHLLRSRFTLILLERSLSLSSPPHPFQFTWQARRSGLIFPVTFSLYTP